MSQVATYRDKRQVAPIPYAPGGCPVILGEEKCGETRGLEIIKDFHELYQEKMSQIDVSAGGDSLQEKVDLQQKWINDLTEQNRMLAKVIEELETEAIGRLQQLENKLKNAAKSFGEENKEALDGRGTNNPPQSALTELPSTTDDSEKRIVESDRQKQGDPRASADRDRGSKEIEYATKDMSSSTDFSNKWNEEYDREQQENKEVSVPQDRQNEEIENALTDDSSKTNKEDEDVIQAARRADISRESEEEFEVIPKELPPAAERRNEENKSENQEELPSTTGSLKKTNEENGRKKQGPKRASVDINRIEENLIMESQEDREKKAGENDLPTQVGITSSPSERHHDEKPILFICPVKKNRPCFPETCIQLTGKSSERTSSVQKKPSDFSAQPYSEREIKNHYLAQEPSNSIHQTATSAVQSERRSSNNFPPAKKEASIRSKLGTDNLDKKSVQILIEADQHNWIVEPEKDPYQPSLEMDVPHIDSVAVIGTQDSLEIIKAYKKSSNSERSLTTEQTQNKGSCICKTTYLLEEIANLKNENKLLREGEEMKQLRNELNEKMKRILELNEENRTLNDTVNVLKNNQSLKWTSKEKEEYEYLKQKVKLLEQGRGDIENITSNLQTAVDLYVNTIQLLERSEQKLKFEVEQYRNNNEVMEESLISLSHDMEDLRAKFHQDIEEQLWLNFILHIESMDIQHANAIHEHQIDQAQKLHLQLMDLNYDLELEHVNTLQDQSMLETQLYKYQSILKTEQEDKTVMKVQLKKLSKKNKCYEEIVQFFKEEMSVMSDELLTLQEVLNVTNISSQEENTRLINAILQLRRINDRLVSHLCEIEKQVVLENQINQINEARINELQNIIGSKNNDLNQHDQTIQEMKKKLSNAQKQNADLKKTIKNLTDAVVEIQEGIKSVERDHNRNRNDVSIVESRVCLANGNLNEIRVCIDQKNSKIMDLQNQLKNQEVSIILATKELEVLKEKKLDYKQLIASLKDQLAAYEKDNEEMMGDYQLVSNQLQDYTNLDHMKNYELSHYKGLVEEMKISLMQMNYGLEKCEATNIHFYEEIKNSDISSGSKSNLPVAFKDLRKSVADMKRRLSDAEFKGSLIEEELLKVKESHMSQIQEEVTESQKDLETKILASIEEQAKLNLLVEQQKEEIEELKKELEKEKLDSCSYKRSISDLKNENKMTSNAQMEILHLKCELNKSLQRQRLLNEENDKIHSKMISHRKKLSTIEHAYEVMKQENEEYKIQLKKTLREKEYIEHKNQELTKSIEQMRTSHDQLEKQCRYTSDCVQNLELELSETQTEKDNISSEAQNLAQVVKMWLQEQNNINGEIRGKFQNYSASIASLRESMMKRMSQEKGWIKKPMQQPFSPRRYGTPPQSDRRSTSPGRNRRQERHSPDDRYRSSSPWQCSSSFSRTDFLEEDDQNQKRNISYDSNPSPFSSRSPSPISDYLQGEVEMNNMNLNDWFSPNFKETDTDAEEGDDDFFINKLHVLTAQVQEANKRWQQKMNASSVSTSRAKNSKV